MALGNWLGGIRTRVLVASPDRSPPMLTKRRVSGLLDGTLVKSAPSKTTPMQLRLVELIGPEIAFMTAVLSYSSAIEDKYEQQKEVKVLLTT